MSWMTPMDAEREKLEGVPLTLCTDCKDMVVQVPFLLRIYFHSLDTQHN